MSVRNADELNRELSEATDAFVSEIGAMYSAYSNKPVCESDIRELATQTLSVLSRFKKAIVEYARENEKR